LPQKKFRQCVERYKGNNRVRTFSCYDQLLCMAFAQLTYRESLRDIECCLRSVHEKVYHIGIRGKVSRSTLSDANENRDWRIYHDFAHVLIQEARSLYVNDFFGLELDEVELFFKWIKNRPLRGRYWVNPYKGIVYMNVQFNNMPALLLNKQILYRSEIFTILYLSIIRILDQILLCLGIVV
jgi:hypothetical protein